MTSTDLIEADRYRLLFGRCEERLKELESNSVHAVITDPPYGLSVEPDMAEVLKHWLAGDDYTHRGGGFMGRSWDSFVPGPSIWREIYRVLKPGGMLAAFAGTRTADLMGIAIRLAGFERRDTVLHIGSEMYVLPDDAELGWVYATGFPKEGDLGVAVDEHLGHEPREVSRPVERGYDPVKGFSLLEEHEVVEEAATRSSGIGAAYKGAAEDGSWKPGAGQERVVEKEPVSEEGKRWQGWSTVLKPANEPIILARKPLTEKNIPANVVKHGVGGLNIQAGAVGEERRVNPPSAFKGDRDAPLPLSSPDAPSVEREGRWPPNVALSHTAHCRFVGVESRKRQAFVQQPIGVMKMSSSQLNPRPFHEDEEPSQGRVAFVKDGEEKIEVWECVPGCPVREMDQQGAGDEPWRKVRFANGDEGFSQGVTRFLYCAKPTRKEKDAGIKSDPVYRANRAGGSGIARDNRVRELMKQGLAQPDAEARMQKEMGTVPRNTHLTVKPIRLMQWLVRLLTPVDGIVLDPFMGSGSTGCAAMLEGMQFVGCELEEESWEIARQRIEHWEQVAQTKGQQATLF